MKTAGSCSAILIEKGRKGNDKEEKKKRRIGDLIEIKSVAIYTLYGL